MSHQCTKRNAIFLVLEQLAHREIEHTEKLDRV